MEHTDQVVYDAFYMTEDEFIAYYKLYWQESVKVVKKQRDLILQRIKEREYEVICYLVLDSKTDKSHFFHKSAICYLEAALKAAEQNKEAPLYRCDTFEGIAKKSVDIEKEIDIDRLISDFPNRMDQVTALYYNGITNCNKIADLLGTNASYVNRLLNRIKFEQ